MKQILSIALLMLLSGRVSSQSGYDFYLSVPPDVTLTSLAETNDGGFIVCGSGLNFGDDTRDFYFSRFDSTGSFLWQTLISDTTWANFPTDDYVQDIITNSDGSFTFSGTVSDPNDFFYKTAILAKIDSTGSIIMQQYINDGISASGGDLRKFDDTTFIFLNSNYYGAGHHADALQRFNLQLTSAWNSPSFENYGFNSVAINQAGYIFRMCASPDYHYSLDYFQQPVVQRFNSQGTQEWECIFSREAYSNAWPRLQAVTGTATNGAMICGSDSLPGNSQICLISISPTGDSTGIRRYGSSRYEESSDITLSANGSHVITGTAEDSCLVNSRNIFLFKVNQNGDSVWFRIFPGLFNNIGSKVLSTNDGGYLIFGTSDNYYRVIKTDSAGIVNSANPYRVEADQGCAVYCSGDSAELSVNLPASSFVWSTGESTPTILVTGSGNYYVQVTDTAAQTYVTPFFNVIFLNATGSFATDSIVECNEAVLNFSSANGPGYHYRWYMNGVLLPNETSESLIATTTANYQLSISSICGSDSSSIYAEINPSPSVPSIYIESPGLFCAGDSIRISTDPGAYSYQWFSDFSYDTIFGETDSFIYIHSDALISVGVGNANGCASYSQTIYTSAVTASNPPLVAIPATATCPGDTVILKVQYDQVSYHWSTGDTSKQIYITQPGIYYCNVNNGTSCASVSDSLEINFLFVPPMNLGNDTLLCVGTGINLLAGPGFTSYLWQDSSVLTSFYANSLIPGTYQYYCTGTASNNCGVTDSITIVFDACNGIQNAGSPTISVFPNPLQGDVLNIMRENSSERYSVSIYSMDGKMLLQHENVHSESIKNLNSKLSPGVYLLLVESGEKRSYFRLLRN